MTFHHFFHSLLWILTIFFKPISFLNHSHGIALITLSGEISSCLGFLQLITIQACKWLFFLHVWNWFFSVIGQFVWGSVIAKSRFMSTMVTSGYNVIKWLPNYLRKKMPKRISNLCFKFLFLTKKFKERNQRFIPKKISKYID
jgi:hypothetical protein